MKYIYDLSGGNIFLSKSEESENIHVLITSKEDVFIGSSLLVPVDNDTYVVDGVVARPRYGYTLHRALLSVSTQLGRKLAIVRDGDAKHGALTVWSQFYQDESIKNTLLAETLNQEIDWTNIDENPEFFYGFTSRDSRWLPKPVMTKGKESEKNKTIGDSAFDRSYDTYSNLWIETEMPIHQEDPVYILQNN